MLVIDYSAGRPKLNRSPRSQLRNIGDAPLTGAKIRFVGRRRVAARHTYTLTKGGAWQRLPIERL